MKPLRPPSLPRPCLPDLLALLALAAGIAARIARAWVWRVTLDQDQAVVGLMARHMARGSDFPIFFYGQSYMGSLEPATSALLFKLFGESGFVLRLGPVLFGCLALWALWRWGRDAAGPWGGLLALLGGLFGPLMHFHFQAAARGGYMVALAIEILAMLFSCRMAAALREGRPPRLRAWVGLGFMAGVGLWTNLNVAAALAVSALLLAWGMRWRPWRHPGALSAAAAATVAGISPWILDCIRRGGMDHLVRGVGYLSPGQTLHCLLENYRNFLDGKVLPLPASLAYATAITALAATGALLSLRHRRGATPLQNAARASAAAFALLFAGIYAFSSFVSIPTGRYWIPLAPALALLSALACVLPRRRAVRTAAFAAWAAVFALQSHLAVCGLRGSEAYVGHLRGQVSANLRAFREAGIHEALMPLSRYYINYLSRETVAVSDGRKGFYRPVLRTVELSDSPFYATDYPGIHAWLDMTGAQSTSVSAGAYSFFASLRCPLPADRELPDLPHPADGPADPIAALGDRRIDTWWSPPRKESSTLEWDFPEPRALSCLRLQFTHRVVSLSFAVASRVRIETRAPDGAWTLLREVEFPHLATSLGRPYPSDFPGIVEIPFGGLTATGLRATFILRNPEDPRRLWRLAEAALFEPVPDDASDRADTLLAPEATLPVAEALDAHPGHWLFAPRRLSGLLVSRHGADPDRLGGLPVFGFERSPAPRAEGVIPPDRPVALCIEPRMLPAAERVLRTAFRSWTAEPAGPWTLLYLDEAPDTAFPLQWDGDAPLAIQEAGPIDRRTDSILRALSAGQDASEAIRELAAIRPESLAALPEDAVLAAGGTPLATLRAGRGDIPAFPCDATFSDGLRLRGLDVSPAAPRPGGELSLTLHWQACGKPHPPGHETTFVHVCDSTGRIVAQLDWFGVANVAGRPDFNRPLHEFLPETRTLRLPKDLPPGPLQIRVGRTRPGWRWRVPVSSPSLPVSRRALLFDGLLEIPPS